MTKRLFSLAALLVIAAAFAPAPATAADNWTGEVIDHACFTDRGAHGPDHVSCAKRCFENGGEVGLLTADGEVMILRAHADHADAFDAVKALAGAQASVTGEMMEDEEGHMYVAVTAVEEATT